MTQHGSFPGRPRGRRGRPDNGASEWQGYDATPQDEREFPDLTPIRPRDSRARDGRGPGESYPGQAGGYPAQDGAYPAQDGGYPAQGGPYPPPGAGYPQGGPGPGGPGPGSYGAGQPGGQYRGGEYPGGAHQDGTYQDGAYQDGAYQDGAYQESGAAQPPWGDAGRDWPGQQPQAPEQRSAQPSQSSRPEPSLGGADDDEDVPSWAEPDSVEAFSSRWHRRGLDSRDERRAGRRKRRRLLIAAGIVLALIIGTVSYLLSGGPGAADLGFGGFVTTFQQGELQQVPNPCTEMPSAALQQYLPGHVKQSAPPLNSGASTECTWTLDSAPTYRVLQVQFQAYSPSGLASGNGSASFAALDAYESFENGFAKPGPHSGQPPATVTELSGMPGGTYTSAFQATQTYNRGGATMDVANVLVRYRNVIITVVVDGLAQSSGKKKYGPVAMSDLTSIADSVGKEMATQIAK